MRAVEYDLGVYNLDTNEEVVLPVDIKSAERITAIVRPTGPYANTVDLRVTTDTFPEHNLGVDGFSNSNTLSGVPRGTVLKAKAASAQEVRIVVVCFYS